MTRDNLTAFLTKTHTSHKTQSNDTTVQEFVLVDSDKKPPIHRRRSYLSSISGEPVDIKFVNPYDLSIEFRDEIIQKYINVFDESANVILRIVESDIWPRFRKSPFFRRGMNQLTSANDIKVEP